MGSDVLGFPLAYEEASAVPLQGSGGGGDSDAPEGSIPATLSSPSVAPSSQFRSHLPGQPGTKEANFAGC